MSASIYTLLAEELEISDAKAKKLLSAMLREVHKRARRDGVQLPNFGRFKEEDGALVFEPDESLALAVNHRFEGLTAEDLSGAPMDEDDEESQSDGPNTITLGYQDGSNWSPIDAEDEPEDEDASSDEAPDTAEFQVPDVDDSGERDAPADTDDSTSEPAPDTAEISPPTGDPDAEAPDEPTSPEEEEDASAAPTAPDDGTEAEEETDEPDSEPSSSKTSSTRSTGARETEKLYPLVEDVPGPTDQASDDDSTSDDESSPDSPTMAPPDDDRERDSLSGIWDDEADDEPADTPESAAASTESDAPEPATTDADDSAPDASSDASSSSPPSTQFEMPEPDPPEPDPNDPDPDDPDPSERAPKEPAADRDAAASSSPSGSSLPRVLVTILVFVLLGSGAWYILGQRGMVQSPRATYAQLMATLQSAPSADATQNSTSTVPEFSPSDESSPDTTTATADASPDSTPSSPPTASASPDAPDAEAPTSDASTTAETDAASSSGTETADRSSSSSSTAASTSPDAAADASPRTLAPDEGGWSIIVASRTDRDAARSLADTFRERFRAQNIPTGVLEASVDNSTRYRVGVGQFASSSDVQKFLDEHSEKLPNGAWAIQL